MVLFRLFVFVLALKLDTGPSVNYFLFRSDRRRLLPSDIHNVRRSRLDLLCYNDGEELKLIVPFCRNIFSIITQERKMACVLKVKLGLLALGVIVKHV